MKKILIGLFILAMAMSVFSAGVKVFDIRNAANNGIAYFDTIQGTIVGGIYSATSDITCDDIICNTITPDTIVGATLCTGTFTMGYIVIDSTDAFKAHGDITIGAGYELHCDSAVIDTVAIALANITVGTIATSLTIDGGLNFTAGSSSCLADSVFYVNGGKDTAWIYINGVKMILAVEP